VDDELSGSFSDFWWGLAFDLNANPERTAFLATIRRGGQSQFTRNSLGGTIQ
jgi:hypothetical protein